MQASDLFLDGGERSLYKDGTIVRLMNISGIIINNAPGLCYDSNSRIRIFDGQHPPNWDDVMEWHAAAARHTRAASVETVIDGQFDCSVWFVR